MSIFIVIVALSVILFQNVTQQGQKNTQRQTTQRDKASPPGERNTRSNRNRRRATNQTNRASSITGRAYVVDGDSLEIDNVSIRLFGIDAPEGRQYCKTQTGEDWPCGRQATSALRRFINNRQVTCARRDTDRYGRMVAVCKVGETDLNGWMTANGHALAYRKFTRDYIPGEQSAKAAKRGIWRGDFTPPWQWRRENRRR